MIRINISSKHVTISDSARTISPKLDDPLIVWIRDNVGDIYDISDFYRYWRGTNWEIKEIDKNVIAVDLYNPTIETITMFKLRWL